MSGDARGDPGRRFDGGFYLAVSDVQVGTQAHEAWFARGGEHAFAGEGLQELGGVFDGDEDEVGLRFSGVVACLSQSRGEVAGPGVVFGEPFYVLCSKA